MSSYKTSRFSVLLLCLTLTFLCQSAFAEPPKFKAPEVNQYVERQTKWMDEYAAAAKAGDAVKRQAAEKAMREDADKNMFAIYEKLTDAEKPIYDKWVKAESDRMAEAIKTASTNGDQSKTKDKDKAKDKETEKKDDEGDDDES